jgi:hypothetical protein
MFVEIKSDNRRLQNPMLCFLLEPNYRATWYLMVRTNYLRSCRVFEHYITDYKVNQEPGIFLPLAAGGGKLQYIKKILYNHNDTGRRRGGNDIDDLMPEYYSSYGPLCQAVIAKLGLPEKECDLLKEIAIIGCHAQLMTLESNASRKDRLASEFAAHVNLVLPVSEIVTEGDILRFGCELYLKTVYNYYTGGFENFGNMIKPLRRACRVIGVGALGAAAGHRLPMLIECGVTPDALWDSGAVDGSEIFGIPVVQPDYENLQRDDLVVMFSKKENTLASIIQNIKEARKQVNFFMAEDIERLYSAHLIQKN